MTGPGGDQDAFIVECLLNGDVCLDSMIAYYCELGGIAPHLAGLLRGEAEALEICHTNGFALLSNDHNAVLDARRDGIRIGSMIDVLAVMVLRAGFNATQAWATYEGFLGRDMHPVPGYPKGAVGEAAFKELMTLCLARRAAAPTAAATSPSPKRPAKTP